jgi:ketosteroid isomerase-like protein
MTQTALTEEEVLKAAAGLVAAFGGTQTRAYFDCFTEDATFVFHTEARRLDSRADYEQLWAGWLDDGWRVTACVSSNQGVQLMGPVAVFTHDVHTTTSIGGVPEATQERETIVFRRLPTGILAVHEHLSPTPDDSPEKSAP